MSIFHCYSCNNEIDADYKGCYAHPTVKHECVCEDCDAELEEHKMNQDNETTFKARSADEIYDNPHSRQLLSEYGKYFASDYACLMASQRDREAIKKYRDAESEKRVRVEAQLKRIKELMS